nr:basic proline-rich protein-like [Aegilops tauschii subsp. strangulata]
MACSRDGDGDPPPPAALVPPAVPSDPVAAPASAPPPPLPAPPAAAVPPLPPLSPAPTHRVRWADLADEDPLPSPAGHPSPSPAAPRRTAQPGRTGGSAPQVRDSAAGSWLVRSPTPPSSSTRAAGMQGVALRNGGGRRRRDRSWGVAGRSDRGSSRASWRRPLAALRPVTALASPATRAGPAPMAPAARSSPFRPFIATFGSFSLRFRASIPCVVPGCPSPAACRWRWRLLLVVGKPSGFLPPPPPPPPPGPLITRSGHSGPRSGPSAARACWARLAPAGPARGGWAAPVP